MINALSFDLEDWYQRTNLDSVIGFNNWDKCESRIEKSAMKLLDTLRNAKAKATFFVLGWIAERYPKIVKQIHNERHEIATHGYSHKLVYTQKPEEFSYELRKSIDILQNITNNEIIGHIAASFSIVQRSFWAFKILVQCGIKYDCSIFPIKNPLYGVPDAPRFPYTISVDGSNNSLIEFPCSTVRLFGQNIGFSGGAYFRLLPYWFIKAAFKQINSLGQPVIFYLHPWEIDPEQPRVRLDFATRLRSYVNLDTTEKKLRRLLRDFAFAPVRQVLDI